MGMREGRRPRRGCQMEVGAAACLQGRPAPRLQRAHAAVDSGVCRPFAVRPTCTLRWWRRGRAGRRAVGGSWRGGKKRGRKALLRPALASVLRRLQVSILSSSTSPQQPLGAVCPNPNPTPTQPRPRSRGRGSHDYIVNLWVLLLVHATVLVLTHGCCVLLLSAPAPTRASAGACKQAGGRVGRNQLSAQRPAHTPHRCLLCRPRRLGRS
jgi:hypothetical protein